MIQEKDLFSGVPTTDEAGEENANQRIAEDVANGMAKAFEEHAAQTLASNLTLLMPPRIEVDFMEWDKVVDPESGEETLMPRIRRASISTYVPMRIFHAMLAGRSSVLRLKQEETNNPEHQAKMMEWMTETCLAVWQRTEPKMTQDRFENCLQMPQILELFQRFFGGLMARMNEQSRFALALQGS